MATSPPDLQRFDSFDGQSIAWRELGEGRAVILVHGLFSHGELNWLRFGHAQAVAAAGFRVILPDLRGHGASAKPRDASAWPPDALARDIRALTLHLGLADRGFDLGGYSLGARTVLRACALGAEPRRLVLAGMGLDGLASGTRRAAFFRGAILGRDGTDLTPPQRYALAFARTNGADLEACLHLLDQFTDLKVDAATLPPPPTPTLVVAGSEDGENGSAAALAAAIPGAVHAEIGGNHATAVTRPGLGAAIAGFLGA